MNLKKVNYESTSSNSHNYCTDETSSSPLSFPSIVGDGIIIEYKQVNYSSEMITDPSQSEEENLPSNSD